jgi:hypothetical protein
LAAIKNQDYFILRKNKNEKTSTNGWRSCEMNWTTACPPSPQSNLKGNEFFVMGYEITVKTELF